MAPVGVLLLEISGNFVAKEQEARSRALRGVWILLLLGLGGCSGSLGDSAD